MPGGPIDKVIEENARLRYLPGYMHGNGEVVLSMDWPCSRRIEVTDVAVATSKQSYYDEINIIPGQRHFPDCVRPRYAYLSFDSNVRWSTSKRPYLRGYYSRFVATDLQGMKCCKRTHGNHSFGKDVHFIITFANASKYCTQSMPNAQGN